MNNINDDRIRWVFLLVTLSQLQWPNWTQTCILFISLNNVKLKSYKRAFKDILIRLVEHRFRPRVLIEMGIGVNSFINGGHTLSCNQPFFFFKYLFKYLYNATCRQPNVCNCMYRCWYYYKNSPPALNPGKLCRPTANTTKPTGHVYKSWAKWKFY